MGAATEISPNEAKETYVTMFTVLDHAVDTVSANGMLGSRFTSWYRLLPKAKF